MSNTLFVFANMHFGHKFENGSFADFEWNTFYREKNSIFFCFLQSRAFLATFSGVLSVPT